MISFAYTIGVMKLIRVELNTNGLDNLTTTQKYLLVVLATFANSEGECWPSQNKLARIIGVSHATVLQSKGIQKLLFYPS